MQGYSRSAVLLIITIVVPLAGPVRAQLASAPALTQPSVAPGRSTPMASGQIAQAPPRQTPPTGPAGGQPEPPVQLEEVVVTATRTELPLSQAASAITVIRREEIERQQVPEALEVLRDVPGLTVTQTNRGGSSSVFARGGESDFNLVLVDGIKVNVPGGSFDFGDFTMENVERIEVLRGPQSALYGADAMGSVIQLLSRRGRGPLQVEGSFGGGRFATFEERVSLAGGTDALGYSFAAGRVDAGGHLRINHKFEQTALSGRVDLVPLEPLQVRLTARYTNSLFRFPTESGGDLLDKLDPHQFQRRERLILGANLTAQATPWWQQVLQVGHASTDFRSIDPFDPGIDFSESATKTLERRVPVDYAWHFTLPRVADVGTVLTVGGAFEEETFRRRTLTGASVDKSRSNKAGYVQAQFDWAKRIFLTPGVRVDDNETFGTDTNPRVQLAVLLPPAETKLRGGYATGIKEPSFIDNFGTGSPFVVGNPDLKPEQSKSWEVGVDQSLLGGRAAVGATYFFSLYDNLIAFVSGSPSFRNIQRARSRGIETELRATLVEGLTIKGSYTFLQTRVIDDGGVGDTVFQPGQPLIRRPKHRGAVSLDYSQGPWQANFNVTVVGASRDVNFAVDPSPSVTLPGYHKADLAVSYRLTRRAGPMPELRLTGRVSNLFGQAYQELFGFSAPPLTYLFGLSGRF